MALNWLHLVRAELFLRNPFPVCFWLEWGTRDIFVWSFEGLEMKQKFVLLFLFVFFWKFNEDVFVTHTGHLSAGLPYWHGRTFMSANAPPYHRSSFSFSGSWVRCVISSVTKGASFFYRKLTSPKSEVEILACVLVSSSPEFQLLFIFSPIACPVDIKL